MTRGSWRVGELAMAFNKPLESPVVVALALGCCKVVELCLAAHMTRADLAGIVLRYVCRKLVESIFE